MEITTKDKFGQTLYPGDDVLYTYCQEFRRGKVERITASGNVVVNNWPITRNQSAPKSLGRWKECVKIYLPE